MGKISRDYQVRLLQAAAKEWRVERDEAKAIAEYAVINGEIEPDMMPKLLRYLDSGAIMRRPDGNWVCETCGGNCGQCGMTDFVGNVGFSFDRIAAGINPAGQTPKDYDASDALAELDKMGAKDKAYKRQQWWLQIGRFLSKFLPFLAAVAAFAFVAVTLVGCESIPGTCVGCKVECDTCIGPYDITLSSHREALGLAQHRY